MFANTNRKKASHSTPLWSKKILDAKPRPNLLNSFWGKFGENLHKPTTEAVQNAHHLFALVSNPFNDIRQVRLSNDETLEVVYANLQDNQPDNGRVNIFIAAFTTCHARLKLYSYLEQLQQRVPYFDTDSVIYTVKPGQPDIPLGDYLGEMTDDLDHGDFIVEFTSAGPKNYGYKAHQGRVCCKVRGFTLNVRGSQQLNYDVVRQNLIDEITQPLDERRNIDVVNPNFFLEKPRHQASQSHNTRQTLRTRLRQTRRRPEHFHVVSLRIHPGHLKMYKLQMCQ